MAVPKIRFPGFTEDWEQRKLSGMATFSKGSGYSKADLKTSGKPIILYGRMYTKYETIIRNVDTFAEEKAGSVYSESGDVIVPASGETAQDISRASVVANSGILLGGDINIIHPNNELNPGFLALTISNGNQQKKLSMKAQGATIVHLHNEDLKGVDILCPSIDEQTLISEFFERIDNTITLHQRKLESIKLLKKSLLQKMFPKSGETVPEVRFPGFTDAWEQRKFVDFAQRESTLKLSCSDCPSVEYEDVIAEEGRLNKDIRQKEIQKTGIYFNGSQVLYGKLRPYLHNWLNPDFTGVAVGDWWVLRPSNMDKSFLYRLLQTDQFDAVANQSSGSKMPRADWKLVSNTEFIVPHSEKEQHKIAEFFNSIDDLITLHQRKVEILHKLKKSLLQQMFV